MSKLIRLDDIMSKIIKIRGTDALLDSVVADLYDVETKEINQAVKNNPKKFPEGYVLELTSDEYKSLRSKKLTLEKSGRGQHAKYLPKAFTEKGLYMLATIIKGDKAIETTIDIIESFAKLRELSRTISELSASPDELTKKTLMQKSGEIIAEILGDDMQVSDTETTLEINFAVMKFKHTVRRKK